MRATLLRSPAPFIPDVVPLEVLSTTFITFTMYVFGPIRARFLSPVRPSDVANAIIAMRCRRRCAAIKSPVHYARLESLENEYPKRDWRRFVPADTSYYLSQTSMKNAENLPCFDSAPVIVAVLEPPASNAGSRTSRHTHGAFLV